MIYCPVKPFPVGITLGMQRNYGFLLHSLILRDFKIRYRNMSLGVFWSLLNPLVMLGVLVFVFTRIFPGQTPYYSASIICGLVPFNFFSLAWSSGTTSVFANSGLVKRVRFPREIVPISTVLSNTIHFLIQIGLVLTVVLLSGLQVNRYWLLLPVLLALELVFVCGISLITSALDVYLRDIRYVVESANMVLFWVVPIFYGFQNIPPQYRSVYQYNPIAAVVLACRDVLIEGRMPASSLLIKLVLVSLLSLLLGLAIFGRLKRRFADYL